MRGMKKVKEGLPRGRKKTTASTVVKIMKQYEGEGFLMAGNKSKKNTISIKEWLKQSIQASKRGTYNTVFSLFQSIFPCIKTIDVRIKIVKEGLPNVRKITNFLLPGNEEENW